MRRRLLTCLVLLTACGAGAHRPDPAAVVRRAAATTVAARTARAHVEVALGEAHVATDAEVDFEHGAERTPFMRRIGTASYVLPSDSPRWLAVTLGDPTPSDPLQRATFDALRTATTAEALGGGAYRAAGVDLWLDDGGRIRRIVRHLGEATVTVEYRDFGRPVDITAPDGVDESLLGEPPDA